jgi:ATP-binding cassette, subfamily B, bacterial
MSHEQRTNLSSRAAFNTFRSRQGRDTVDPSVSQPEKASDACNSRAAGSPSYTRGYLKFLRPHAGSIAALILIALCLSVLQLVPPLCLRYIVDQVLLKPGLSGSNRLAMLNLVGLSFLTVVLISGALGVMREVRQRRLSRRLMLLLRRSLFEKLLRIPLAALEDMKTGGILARLSSGIDSGSGLVPLAIISPIISAARLAIAVVIVLALNPRLALISLAVTPAAAFVSWLHAKRIQPIYLAIRQDIEVADAHAGEAFSGMRVVRAFRRETRELRKYVSKRHAAARSESFAFSRDLLLWSCWGFVMAGAPVGIAWYGGHLFLTGQASIGDLMAFNWYSMLILDPVWLLVQSFSEVQRSLAATERVFQVLAMPDDKPDRLDATDAPQTIRELRFERVEFEYRNGIPVLHELDFAVPGGAVVALVGRSGSGKTTMADLVARFHDPTRGRILLNGVDIRRFRLSSYRRLLAVVPQDVFLFDGSVRENIAYGKRSASEREIEAAARLASAHEFIMRLPQQYATEIGQRGWTLSGGQRQRLAFARAVLADPQILILDEATSNLDSESEQAIEASLGPLMAGRTTFIVAHRLSTVRSADLILVIDDGRIVERGTNESLLAARGFYHDMVRRQTGINGSPSRLRDDAWLASRN